MLGLLLPEILNVTGIATFGTLDVDVVAVAQYAQVAGIATVAGYASSTGIATYATNAGSATIADNSNLATLASGLSGNPDIIVENIDASTLDLNSINATGIITAATFIGDGSQLSNIGGGLGIPVTGTDGMFNGRRTFNNL